MLKKCVPKFFMISAYSQYILGLVIFVVRFHQGSASTECALIWNIDEISVL